MPESKPSPITLDKGENAIKLLEGMVKQLNFIINDIYNYIDGIYGYGGRTFTPQSIAPTSIAAHPHTSAETGGDYPWADVIAADISWLQAVRATILATSVWDKLTAIPAPLLVSDPSAPASGAVIYVKANGAVKELKARFANGTIKVVTDDV